MVWAVRVVEPDGVLSVVDSEAESVAGGLAELVPLVVCGFDVVPQPGVSTLSNCVRTVCWGGVAHPGAALLREPGFDLTRKVRALAQGGDESCLRTFREIQSLYSDGTQYTDAAWAWWIDERELAWHEAMCKQDLGDSKSAIVQFERSVEATPSTQIRSQYVHLAYLLAAQVKLRSWAAADSTMRELQSLAGEVASTRTVVLIRQILRELQAEDNKAPRKLLERGVELEVVLGNAPV